MAKKFNFKLQSVLNLRKHRVEEAKLELHDAMRVRIKKDQLIADRQQYHDELLKSEIRSTTAADFQIISSHRSFVEDEIERLEDEKNQILEIELFRKKKLAGEMQKEKVFDKLKQKQLLQYNEEVLKEENQTLDEVAINRHGDNNNLK